MNLAEMKVQLGYVPFFFFFSFSFWVLKVMHIINLHVFDLGFQHFMNPVFVEFQLKLVYWNASNPQHNRLKLDHQTSALPQIFQKGKMNNIDSQSSRTIMVESFEKLVNHDINTGNLPIKENIRSKTNIVSLTTALKTVKNELISHFKYRSVHAKLIRV